MGMKLRNHRAVTALQLRVAVDPGFELSSRGHRPFRGERLLGCQRCDAGRSEKPSHMLMQAAQIKKTYVATRVPCDVAFRVCPGEIHALLDGNSPGKSTLGRIITGLTPS
ncbi:hypothetical protein NKH14_31440 [Mesorhizobium sp. M1380]|uniref:hypothetical protein n=2 Tax=unclassified Mesorhizobium TaxID=325217 RepID=UPI0033399E32